MKMMLQQYFIVVVMLLVSFGASTGQAATSGMGQGRPRRCAGSRTYALYLDGKWTKESHPVNPPTGNTMWSRLLAISHSIDVKLADVGMVASQGVVNVAEAGDVAVLENELIAALGDNIGHWARGSAGSMGGGLSGIIYVTVDGMHPMLSFISMVAPSPDWFIHGSINACGPNGVWRPTLEVQAMVYDAGSDSGTSHDAANQPTTPRQPISMVMCGPVFCQGSGAINPPLAYFRGSLLCEGTMRYEVTLQGMWTSMSHPLGYPTGARFSPPVVASHGANEWPTHRSGSLASPGLEMIAETGATEVMVNELKLMKLTGQVLDIDAANGPLMASGNSTTLYLTVDSMRSYISSVSMLAPSPDWFMGVRMNMCLDGRWRLADMNEMTVYDAGTDSGPMFMSPDTSTVPPAPVTRIQCNGEVFCGMGQEFPPIAKASFVNSMTSCRSFRPIMCPMNRCRIRAGRCVPQ